MDKNNLYVIIGIVVLIILVLIIFFVKYNKTEKEEELNVFGRIVNIWEKQPTAEEKEKRKSDIDALIKSGAVINENVEIEDNYAKLKIYYGQEEKEYTLGYTGDELTATLLVEGVANCIGYNIEAQSIEKGKSKVKIDLSEQSAPFNIDTRKVSDYFQGIEILDKAELSNCIFKSVSATIKENFGKNMKVYFSKNGKDILIDDIEPNIKIQKNRQYKISK